MFDMLKTAALSAMIGLGAITALPAAAQADSLYLGFGDHYDGGRFGVQFGGDRGHYRDRDYYGGRDYYHERRTCTPGEAVRKAWRIGLRNPRVVDVDRRTIDVVGRRHGDRVRVTFARWGDCRIVRI